MKTLRIEKEAFEQIQRILRRSACKSPIAVLVDMGNPDEYMDDVRRGIFEGVDQYRLEKMVRQRISIIDDKVEYRLTILTFEKGDIDSDRLVDISGITFFMDTGMREGLRNYTLSFDRGRFMLRNNITNSIVGSLQSLTHPA